MQALIKVAVLLLLGSVEALTLSGPDQQNANHKHAITHNQQKANHNQQNANHKPAIQHNQQKANHNQQNANHKPAIKRNQQKANHNQQNANHKPAVDPKVAKRRAASAHIYVINLKDRKDRCECMNGQTDSAPYPVFRHDAATPKNQFEKCPLLQGLKTEGSTANHDSIAAQTAIYCSNYNLWNKTQALVNKPEFIIVFEDDVRFDGMKIWPRVQEFLASDCEFDFLAVDTFASGGEAAEQLFKTKKQGAQQCGEDKQFTVGPISGFGAHMQIIRTSALDKMVKFNEAGVYDRWTWMDERMIKARAWWPGQIAQSSMGHFQQVDEKCDKSVKESSVRTKKELLEQGDEAVQEYELETTDARLEC